MKAYNFFYLLIILLPVSGIAQNDTLSLQRGTTYPGYIITLEDDTVHGWLLNINLWLNQHMTFFYDDPDKKEDRIKYKAKELKGYMVGNRIYESIKFPGSYSMHAYNFFMREMTGAIDYYVWYYDPERSKISDTDISLDDISDAMLFEESELSTQQLCRKLNEDMIDLGALKYLVNFDKNMSKLVSDYPELAEKIRNKEEGYKWTDLKKVISEYNKWYQKNH
jgi:hypothetical protein